MTRLLEQTVDQLRQQPADIQDCAAQILRDTITDEVQWQTTFESDASESWLTKQIGKVRTEIATGKATKFDASDLPE